jgi:enoyl-CoA hydratase
VESTLRTVRRGAIALLQLENPYGYPRLERSLLASLLRELSELAADPGCSGVVITGTALAFATGAEISELAALSVAKAFEFSRLGQRVMNRIERSAKPAVAAIRGYCMGGGLDLALACHVRIAGENAVFAHPGGSLGILTGWGGTTRLPRIADRGHALEMLATGRSITSTEAFAMRLVNRVVPDEDVLEAAIHFLRGRTRSWGQS